VTSVTGATLVDGRVAIAAPATRDVQINLSSSHPDATPPAPLAAPTLVAPANAARITAGQTATFDWSDIAGAASYRIQVSSSNTFSTTVLDRIVTPSQLAAALTATGDRFWRVRANDAAGNPGTWSAVRTLRVK
jgi:hypothetical protein